MFSTRPRRVQTPGPLSCARIGAPAPDRGYGPGMSDPQLHVEVDADLVEGAVVAEPQQETWLMKPSQPRWQAWRDHNRRRPPSRAEKRGRVAVAIAGTILGVLGCAGAASYAIQYQGLHR